ncbi:hypothetical protein [Thermaerobacter composti]|uniref:Uncharacterized protein n=1 Tax=Thermaerobacter composti TaxID=554949 RepID=A0ABZ0QUI5_9FIRM|nr:hypothetical protein [Thermaerobacter composti]WPD20195.1 hypothetical protein Q5761_06075 [Thermaerobacter composti]
MRVWRPWRDLQPGDVFQPLARVVKVRKGRPTVIEIEGERYVMMPRSMYLGPAPDGRGRGVAPGEGDTRDDRKP